MAEEIRIRKKVAKRGDDGYAPIDNPLGAPMPDGEVPF